MSARTFASDNGAGVHESVLRAIADANHGHASAYGQDAWTAAAVAGLRRAFGAAEALLTFGGTGANVVALATLTQRYDAILCADSAHIWNSECGAVEHFCGGKLVPVAAPFGKLTPALIAPHLRPTRGVHHARPRVLSLTQPTEWGALYAVSELRDLVAFAHAHSLRVHVDGARLANAAAALEVGFAALSSDIGVDAVSFGGTKNGLLGAEAVLLFDTRDAEAGEYARKQATQLASKMRFIAAQFIAYLERDLWRMLALHANAMARRLHTHCTGFAGLEFVCPVECNMLFPRLPPAAFGPLQTEFPFYLWQDDIARWVTSFDTTPADVDAFAQAIARTLAEL